MFIGKMLHKQKYKKNAKDRLLIVMIDMIRIGLLIDDLQYSDIYNIHMHIVAHNYGKGKIYLRILGGFGKLVAMIRC